MTTPSCMGAWEMCLSCMSGRGGVQSRGRGAKIGGNEGTGTQNIATFSEDGEEKCLSNSPVSNLSRHINGDSIYP